MSTLDPAQRTITTPIVASSTPLESFERTAARVPEGVAMHYFERRITFAELDALSNAAAAALRDAGCAAGDRVAFFLQNDPDFAIAQLAVWKIGAVCVSINPMLRNKELAHILRDSGASALVTLRDLWLDVASEAVAGTAVRIALLTDPSDWTRRYPTPDSDTFPSVGKVSVGLFRDLLSAGNTSTFEGYSGTLDDVAMLCYTSGTSGRPKGVASTHANIAHSAAAYEQWMDIGDDDVFLASAPIFHVTGLIAGLALTYRSGMPMVLFHRFHPEVCLEQIETHRPTFTIMATTAYQALVQEPSAANRDLTSLTKVYSGGAPVTATIDRQWRELTGSGIRNVYGLTETTGPTHAIPLDIDGPLDPDSGAMAVGLPLPGVEARLVDDSTGHDVEVGSQGELWIKGPMVMSGYWQLPEATSEAFVEDYFRTGDVAKQDEAGYYYVIDRLKDMINAAGYKVWPREVEDYLLQHREIREAAVVGIPDEYRGESVKAFVVLQDGSDLTPESIIAFAKSQMAAYKYPRLVEIVQALPKTTTGKVLRRELRSSS